MCPKCPDYGLVSLSYKLGRLCTHVSAVILVISIMSTYNQMAPCDTMDNYPCLLNLFDVVRIAQSCKLIGSISFSSRTFTIFMRATIGDSSLCASCLELSANIALFAPSFRQLQADDAHLLATN